MTWKERPSLMEPGVTVSDSPALTTTCAAAPPAEENSPTASAAANAFRRRNMLGVFGTARSSQARKRSPMDDPRPGRPASSGSSEALPYKKLQSNCEPHHCSSVTRNEARSQEDLALQLCEWAVNATKETSIPPFVFLAHSDHPAARAPSPNGFQRARRFLHLYGCHMVLWFPMAPAKRENAHRIRG